MTEMTINQLCDAITTCHQQDDFAGAIAFTSRLERQLHWFLRRHEQAAVDEARKLDSWCDDCDEIPCTCDNDEASH